MNRLRAYVAVRSKKNCNVYFAKNTGGIIITAFRDPGDIKNYLKIQKYTHKST